MKKLYLVPLIFVLVAILIITACAAPATPSPTSPPPTTTAVTTSPVSPPPTTSAPSPKPTTTAAKPAAPIKLKWAHLAPAQDLFNVEVFIPWTQMIKERTTAIGKPVEITIYPAETLVKGPDTYDAIITGVTQIGSNFGPQHFPGRMPLTEGLNLPLLFSTSASAAMTAQELYDTRPEIQKELREVKILAFHPPFPYQILSKNKYIKTLEDFKGVRSMVRGGTDSDAMRALGATPVPVTMPETYISLERGVIDMAALSWQGAWSFKWHEVTKYRTDLPVGLNTSLLTMGINLDVWNGLPADVQKIFTETTGAVFSKTAGQAQDKAQGKFAQMIKDYDAKAGNPEFYSLPNEEFLKWRQAVTPLYDKFAAERDAKGLAGKSILTDILKLADKYNKEFPR